MQYGLLLSTCQIPKWFLLLCDQCVKACRNLTFFLNKGRFYALFKKIINFYANFFFWSSGPLSLHGSSAHCSSEKGGLKAVYICAYV